MTNSFSFAAYDIGKPTQHIVLRMDGSRDQTIGIPDLQLPDDGVARFWVLHAKLVELGVIKSVQTTFVE